MLILLEETYDINRRYLFRENTTYCMNRCEHCNKETEVNYGKILIGKNLCQGCFKRLRQSESSLKKCECSPECEEMIPSIGFDNKPLRFKIGHQNKLRVRNKHHNWNNGRRHITGGYIKILRTHHPFADKKGYVLEHRYLMELILGRYLDPKEVVHHKDNNKSNNEESNLMLFSEHSKHMSFERKKDMSDRICLLCNSNKTLVRKGDNTQAWFRYKDGFICSKCRDIKRYDLKRKNIWRKKH